MIDDVPFVSWLVRGAGEGAGAPAWTSGSDGVEGRTRSVRSPSSPWPQVGPEVSFGKAAPRHQVDTTIETEETERNSC